MNLNDIKGLFNFNKAKETPDVGQVENSFYKLIAKYPLVLKTLQDPKGVIVEWQDTPVVTQSGAAFLRGVVVMANPDLNFHPGETLAYWKEALDVDLLDELKGTLGEFIMKETGNNKFAITAGDGSERNAKQKRVDSVREIGKGIITGQDEAFDEAWAICSSALSSIKSTSRGERVVKISRSGAVSEQAEVPVATTRSSTRGLPRTPSLDLDDLDNALEELTIK